jgi:L-fuculose-phosphate aldolase
MNNMNINLKFKDQRKEVAYFMRRLYKQRLTTTSGGNISFRIDESIIAITPASTDKGRLRWKEVGLMKLDGENLTFHLKPSLESEMHLDIYRKSKDIKAIVHAHPPIATTFTASGRKIETNLSAEARVIVGEPAIAPYALMGSKELAKIVSDITCHIPVVLMENHGILAVGSTLLQAFDRLEVLEMAAKMNVFIDLIGDKKPLSRIRIDELDKHFS